MSDALSGLSEQPLELRFGRDLTAEELIELVAALKELEE